MNSLLYIGYK